MNIIKPYYEILTNISDGGEEELRFIERAARICYKSESNIKEGSAEKLLWHLIERGHEAMLEHSQLSVLFVIDRGVSHELVRHRLASFAQESTRYVNYAKEKFGSEINVVDLPCNDELKKAWESAMQDAEKHYMKMMELGATPQIARSVLPNSTKTEIVVTANYREWRNILRLRTAPDAHPQMREIMIPLLQELQNRIPIIFDDINAEN